MVEPFQDENKTILACYSIITVLVSNKLKCAVFRDQLDSNVDLGASIKFKY